MSVESFVEFDKDQIMRRVGHLRKHHILRHHIRLPKSSPINKENHMGDVHPIDVLEVSKNHFINGSI